MGVAVVLWLLGVAPVSVSAQIAEIEQVAQSLVAPTDSGWIALQTNTPQIVFTAEVSAPGAAWMRLAFDVLELPEMIEGGTCAELVLTSLADGAVQVLNRKTAREWNNTSAYFNGDLVRVEIIASYSTSPARVRIANIWTEATGVPRNTCGPTDDRTASQDIRVGRALPIGCTAWLITDANRCLLSAGHCAASDGTNLQVIQFNVPLSTSNGTMNHPPPEFQFAVDRSSLQTQQGGTAIGNDWAYFGCFQNATTGLTPFETQGAAFDLSPTPPTGDGRLIRKTGFGTVTSPVSPTLNLAQKTLSGPLTVVNNTTVQYPIDSSGGDSGSPVFQEADQKAIAIHTNGGCPSSGVNSGCSIHHADLQIALANPRGVCIPNYLDFSFPNGRPEPIDPNGTTVLHIAAIGRNGYQPSPGGAVLHVNAGGGFAPIPMTEIEPGVYAGEFPPTACGTVLEYYVTCMTLTGETAASPRDAPADTYSAITGSTITMLHSFNFEVAGNWGVSNTNVTAGAWERGIPQGDGTRGDPTSDYDGSGQCFVTGLAGGDNDLDGGPTRLISPPFALSQASNPHLRYARWFKNDDLDEDRLDVEVSNNFGANWTLLESVPDSRGWTVKTYRLKNFFTPSQGVRLRFNAADQPNNSTTEAGVDAVLIFDLSCPPIVNCTKGDLNADGIVNGLDVSYMVQAVLSQPQAGTYEFCAADTDNDGMIDPVADIDRFVELQLQ